MNMNYFPISYIKRQCSMSCGHGLILREEIEAGWAAMGGEVKNVVNTVSSVGESDMFGEETQLAFLKLRSV
jgi:hypothetical protein